MRLRTPQVRDFIVRHYLKEDGLVHNSKKGNDRRTSIILIGPPGIGKSVASYEGGEKLAEIKKKDFIKYSEVNGLAEKIWANPGKYFGLVDFPLTHTEPTDLIGRPEKHQELPAAYYEPFLWAVCFSKMAGIVFLDELTNVQRLDVISASYKVSLDNLVGFTELSKDVLIIAAGNSPEESSIANLLPWPLLGRFTVVGVDPPTIDEWVVWMDEHYGIWDKRVLGYLVQFKGDFLQVPKDPEGLESFPCPRNWTTVAILLPREPKDPSDEEIYAFGRLGTAVGGKLLAFLKTDIPEIEELIAHPEKFRNLNPDRSKNLDAQYLATVILGSYLEEKVKIIEEKNELKVENPEEVEKTIGLIKVMAETHQDFIALTTMVIGSEKKHPVIAVWIRKDKTLEKCLKEISDFRFEMRM